MTDIDLTWALLALPIAFVLGWVASRLDWRQMRIENRVTPKAYFRGLSLLLNEQQDKAIDAFIEAVQNDPDTSELHFALGNLFRRRGEYQRAVRVHEHLLARGDLSRPERERAQHALALDYLKAGLLDRAERALRQLQGTPLEKDTLLELLSIYERTRDWGNAAEMTRKLEAGGQGHFRGRLAHYLCEQAAERAADMPEDAERLLRQAIETEPAAARPRIELAELQERMGNPAAALRTLTELAQRAPARLPLAAAPLVRLARACRQEQEVLELLRSAYQNHHPGSTDLLQAMVELDAGASPALAVYGQHIEREPSLIAASRWLAAAPPGQAPHPGLQRALEHAIKPLLRYRCASCGFEANRHFWQCPACQAWDSYPPRRIEEL